MHKAGQECQGEIKMAPQKWGHNLYFLFWGEEEMACLKKRKKRDTPQYKNRDTLHIRYLFILLAAFCQNGRQKVSHTYSNQIRRAFRREAGH